MKKITFFIIIFCFFTVFLSAQRANPSQIQVTKFAVVDLQRVHTAFFSNSAQMRQLEENRRALLAEIELLTAEIRELFESRAEAVSQQNSDEIWRLDAEIASKTEYFSSFRAEKNAELEAEERALNDPFFTRVNRVIGRVAESEGITMVLNSRENPGMLWYSRSVDITDRVIQELWR